MVVDFSRIVEEGLLEENPTLVLLNADETPMQVLGTAFNVNASFNYNESSTITFDVPAYVDGVKTPHYDDITGMRLIDMVGFGRFVLSNPSTSNDGIKEIKSCKAYSLEYELTYKKVFFAENVYNFWNPVSPADTVLQILLEDYDSWSIGSVDASLIGKYRTLSEENQNTYNFMKSTLQQSFGCIFDFDTYNRKINVRDTKSDALVDPVYLSLDNLIKEIEIEEDTENVFTVLDVNGADGVDIRPVNPMGSNKIYNLDYYMDNGYFEKTIVSKWNAWKKAFDAAQAEFFALNLDLNARTMDVIKEEAVLEQYRKDELADLENQRAVIVQYLASITEDNSDYTEYTEKLNQLNAQIDYTISKIESEEASIAAKQVAVDSIKQDLADIKASVSFENEVFGFREEELSTIKKYFKEDVFEDSTFVFDEVASFSSNGSLVTNSPMLSYILHISGNEINATSTGDTVVYSIESGSVNLSECGDIIRAVVRYNRSTKGFIFTAYCENVFIDGTKYNKGCYTISGLCDSFSEIKDSDNNIIELTARELSGSSLVTADSLDVEKYSVCMDLYEYGKEILRSVASPAYTFSVSVANFLNIDEFKSFAKHMKLSDRFYIDNDKKVLTPVFIGADINFENINSVSFKFSDKYTGFDNGFKLADLLEQSVSMGASLDSSKYTYSAFIDSGASSALDKFMNSALDVAKNNVLSSSGQGISWDSSGLHLRKYADTRASSEYDPEQIWMINNSIVFTDDNWQTAKMAIGKIFDNNLKSEDNPDGSGYGIVAPYIVGTIVAGKNLVIESRNSDGETVLFRVDSNGAFLRNSKFVLEKDNAGNIAIDPTFGIAAGTANFYDASKDFDDIIFKDTTKKQLNENVKFFLDISDGNAYFGGTVQADKYLDNNGNEMMKEGSYKFGADYLELKGIEVKNGDTTTFKVDNDGNVSVNGDITLSGTSKISWNNLATDAQDKVNGAQSSADSAYSLASAIRNGTVTGTFIDGKNIYSPNIYTNMLTIMPDNREDKPDVEDPYGGLRGVILKGSWRDTNYDFFHIQYYPAASEPYVNIGSDGGTCNWDMYTNFDNDVAFNGVIHGSNYGTSLDSASGYNEGDVFFVIGEVV